MTNKLVLIMMLITGLLFMSCEQNIIGPSKGTTSVVIKLNNSGTGQHHHLFFENENTMSKGNLQKLMKTNTYDEVKLVVLDMTRFKSYEEFLNYWYNSGAGYQLLDTTKLDPTKDIWDNDVLLLKKYTGDAYEYIGDYSFTVSDSIAKGTVYVNPGLNYYFYAFRENGKTGWFDGNYITIVPDSVNTIVLNTGSGTGMLYGYVKDATNDNPLGGASVVLRLNSTNIGTATTGSNGYYSFSGIGAGDYILTASLTNYIAATYPVSIASGEQKTFDISLAPQSSSVQFRIVLTWGSSPSDLDAHLKKGLYDIYFSNKGSDTLPPYATLDVDKTQGYGPETISIYNLNNDSCKYYVNNYSGETDIIQSQAQVKIYSGSALLKSYLVPTSGSGLYWYVFDISPSGTITDRNYITSNQPSPAKFILKRKE